MRQLITDLHYITEKVPSLKSAQAFRELLNHPVKEFERRWGFDKEKK